MSYILDALRRADSERGRGVVPNIHSQIDDPTTLQRASPYRNQLLVWAVVGLALALLAVVAWVALRGQETPAPVAVEAAPVAPAPVAAVPPPPLEAPPQIIATPPPAVIVAPTTAPRVVPERRVETPATTRRPAAVAATPATAAAPVPASSAEARVYAQNELPDNIRSALPTLTIGGAMYSANAASRMLIVNGQLMHEGDKIAPDLVLDQIQLKSAVLRYKNYRYRISY